MKKAQLAVETLLIYGVAILIVMLAIGALISFGILDLGGLLPDTCNIKGGSFTCDEYFLSQTSGLNLEISNSAGKNLQKLELVTVYATNANDAGLITCSGTPIATFTTDGSTPVGTGNPLLNGGKGTLTTGMSCLPNPQLKPGKKLGLNFEIEYQAVGSNLAPKASGSMRVTIVE